MATIESRVFRRADYVVSAQCRRIDAAGSSAFVATTQNISDGGVLLSCSEDLEIPTRIELVLPIGADGAGVAVVAIVRWTRRDGDVVSVGAEFSDDQPGLGAVHALVERLAPTAWGDSRNGALPRRIAVEFVPIVRRMARSVSRSVPVHVDDLVAAGFLGLVEAYRTFRPDLNPSFDAYARLRIRGTMMDEARASDTMSRKQRAMGKVISRARNEYIARHSREPTPQELADLASMSIEAVESHRVAVIAGKPGSDDALDELHDRNATPEVTASRHEGVQQVATALSGLPERLQNILEMYYGQDMTLRSISMVVGVSEARVSQLHSEAIRRLRERCDVG